MKKYTTSQRKVDLYDIGKNLILMNIVYKNDNNVMQHIDTYIGEEGKDFIKVGSCNDLDKPGVIFTYSSFVKTQSANMVFYKQIYYDNLSQGVSRNHFGLNREK